MGRFLITGGAGFIGSHLSDALIARGDTVVVLDNLSSGKTSNLLPECELIVGDIRNEASVLKAFDNIDGVFHLAAIASVAKCNGEWSDSHTINSAGAVRIFHHAAIRNIPVVYASSAAVYGASTDLPLTEACSPNPISAYGLDKLSNEKQAAVAGNIHNLKSCGLRFFNVFGPRQDPSSPYSGVISIFMSNLFKGKKLTIFGDGRQTRDFVYVGDIISMLLAAFQQADTSAPVLNACTGQPKSLKDLIAFLFKISGRNSKVEYQPARQGDIKYSLGSPILLKSLCNVFAKTSFEQGLAKTAEEYTHSQRVKEEV
ncbi:MAG: NAD-dependent epimerase/dehydratase family protein [Sneathiella sp.]